MFPKLVHATVLLGIARNAVAWGAAGHEIVATIAQIHLFPSVLPTICEILNFTSPNPNEPACHLAPIAAWADRQRPKMQWSAPLHYIGAVDDYPSQTCAFPGVRGWAGKDGANVLSGVRNVTDILVDWVYNTAGIRSAEGDNAPDEALKFLIHFLGDMHMPLHLTGRDKGGNSIPVLFAGRKTNLHSLWDGLLIAKALRSVPSKYERPLPLPKLEYALRNTIYDSYVRMIMWEGLMGKWELQIPEWLACPAPAGPRTLSSSFSSFWQQSLFVRSRVTRSIMDDTDDTLICPYHWATPIHALNCEIVWPAALDKSPYNDTRPALSADPPQYLQLDTPEYSGVISERWIVEKLLAQAGIRLAGILNYLFADTEDFEQYRAGSRKLSINF
ncbi:phospholipase C/P1 nuclease domain-containing protein [Mycena crocata]|nr:phospholipase C/P1 nuclease domain-containing protein [Mycena crocata]